MVKDLFINAWRVAMHIPRRVWKLVFVIQTGVSFGFGLSIYNSGVLNEGLFSFILSFILGAFCFAIIVYPFVIATHWQHYFRDLED